MDSEEQKTLVPATETVDLVAHGGEDGSGPAHTAVPDQGLVELDADVVEPGDDEFRSTLADILGKMTVPDYSSILKTTVLPDVTDILSKIAVPDYSAMFAPRGVFDSLFAPLMGIQKGLEKALALALSGPWDGRLLRRLFGRCYRGALALREAIEAGDRGPVMEFLRRELGMWAADEDNASALILVLLEDEWHLNIDTADDKTVKLVLRAAARLSNRFIGEGQILGQKIGYLNASEASGLGFDHYPTSDPGPEAVVLHQPTSGYDNEALNWIMGQLKASERRIVEEFAASSNQSWGMAAEAAGFTTDRGESVRRKLKRLHTEAERRRMLQVAA